MSTLGPSSRTRLVAAGYVGLVTLAALAYEIAGQPEAGETAMTLAAWPGAIVLLVMIYPLAALLGDDPLLGETVFNPLAPLLHGAGGTAQRPDRVGRHRLRPPRQGRVQPQPLRTRGLSSTPRPPATS
ncbi:hypothetical protein ACPXCO_11485 [Streptomyces cyaneofuscatus]|uniref:hypothetical protein n=1 Tax=Streptomyces cyaneofuscatus TaxID=66883 RepID=UPI00341C4441